MNAFHFGSGNAFISCVTGNRVPSESLMRNIAAHRKLDRVPQSEHNKKMWKVLPQN